MALYVCKCLNVSLESDKMNLLSDINELDLQASEQRDDFFSEKLLLCVLSDLKVTLSQPALLNERKLGRWSIYLCLACNQTTHGVLHGKDIVAVFNGLETTRETVNHMKKSNKYSLVFNILVPEMTSDYEMKENVDTNNSLASRPWQPAGEVIGKLNKQLNSSLQSQLEAVEESVRQFRDQKYAEYEAYKEKAQREHKILASIINKSRSVDDSAMETGSDQPPSPHLPPLQRRRLSSNKEAKKHVQNIQDKLNSPLTYEEDSLDAEDIFDLEGTDSRHDMDSDQDDYDSDHSDSRESGIHICSGGDGGGAVARSLPVAVPTMFLERPHRHERDIQDPQDIAASMKAIAKSVHGDVFELPRPRFSTQI